MSDYEQRKQERIARYEARAEKAWDESETLSRQADDMASAIPFGQPVHGQSDRNYRDRIGRKMDKAVAAGEKAKYYEQKAEAARNNTAISSDDPDAIEKLTAKLEKLKALQVQMKEVNAYYRKHNTCVGCESLSAEQAKQMDESLESGDPWTKVPFPSYALSNNNQEIHRIEARIKQLSIVRDDGFLGWEFDGGKVVANSDNNRLQVFFDSVPSADMRQELKARGFHWSRYEKAWQRQLTDNAIYSASRIPAICPTDGTDPYSIQPKRQHKEESR
mgnify:CR=1 FL=1